MRSPLPTEPAPRDVERAVDAMTAALGSAAVTAAADELLEFRDPYWLKGSSSFDVSASVRPTSVEQVQAVVRIANEHRVPLWVISQGRNNTYGGPAPRTRGSVLVNLRDMNRVLEVNEELAYAVVEPGVRWFDLHDAMEAAGGRLWPSIPDLGWGSVVGNTLESGRGYTPYGDHASNVCGLEVVLPSGELVRTGMGAMNGSRVRHVYQHAFGPKLDGLFMQSGLGIVTSMGVWAMRRPEVYISGFAFFQGDDKVAEMADELRELMLDGTIRNFPLIGRSIETHDTDGHLVLNPTSDRWMLRFALYGPAEIVEAQYGRVERSLNEIAGVAIERRTYRGEDRDAMDNHDDRVQGGIPDMQLADVFKIPFGEETGHLDLSPIGPLSGDEVLRAITRTRALYERHGYPYLAGLLLSPRAVIHVSSTFFDPNDAVQTRAVYAAYEEMVAELTKAGYPLYRTNIHHMDLVADQFDFNDHALRRLNETIKDALDPNGILQAGKQGIWPAGARVGPSPRASTTRRGGR